MKIRAFRLKLIEQLIREKEVCSQEQLQELLMIEGFEVTQATLSRDLHTLKAYRSVGSDNKLRYILPETEHYVLDGETQTDIIRGCLSVASNNSMVVIRTPASFARPFALAFERLGLDDILGVIAGYDTVFIALKENVLVNDFYEKVQQKVPDIKVKLH